MAKDEYWKQLTKRLDAVEQAIFDDRKDIDRILIKLSTVEEQNNRILGMQARQQEKTEDAVHDAVKDIIAPVDAKLGKFIKKKVVTIEDSQAKDIQLEQSFWEKVKGWRVNWPWRKR